MTEAFAKFPGPRCHCGDLIRDHRRAGGDLWNITTVKRCDTGLPPIPGRPDTYPRPGVETEKERPEPGLDRPLRPIEQQEEDAKGYARWIREKMYGGIDPEIMPQHVLDRIERIIEATRKASVTDKPKIPRQKKDIPPEEGGSSLPQRTPKPPPTDPHGGGDDFEPLSDEQYRRIADAIRDFDDKEYGDDSTYGEDQWYPDSDNSGKSTSGGSVVAGGGNQKAALISVVSGLAGRTQQFEGQAKAMHDQLMSALAQYQNVMGGSRSQRTSLIQSQLADAARQLIAVQAKIAGTTKDMRDQAAALNS